MPTSHSGIFINNLRYKQSNRFYGMWLMALCLISLNLTSFIYTSDEDFQRADYSQEKKISKISMLPV